MFSRLIPGTDKEKTTLNWFEYWIGHCWMTGWQSMRSSLRNWSDLMTGNHEGYTITFYEDPYEECYNCFWNYLGEDDTLPKKFLEDLMQMAEDVKTGKVETIPFTREMFDQIDDLIGGDLVDKLEWDEDLEEE